MALMTRGFESGRASKTNKLQAFTDEHGFAHQHNTAVNSECENQEATKQAKIWEARHDKERAKILEGYLQTKATSSTSIQQRSPHA